MIVDFEMNKACAAGAGSFLEEQAERLGISIKDEFSALAFQSRGPTKMGERCTVFIESDVMHHQQSGWKDGDIVAGLCYSIVLMFFNKVVGDRHVGKKIFFQGGTAFNKGVVAAFEKVCGKPITVPSHHDVTGAIGAAILAMKEKTWEKSGFKGFDLSKRRSRHRHLRVQRMREPLRDQKSNVRGRDAALLRQQVREVRRGEAGAKLATGRTCSSSGETCSTTRTRGRSTGKVIGIPKILNMHGAASLLAQLFDGTEVLGRSFSDSTNTKIIKEGVENIIRRIVFPYQGLAHGHTNTQHDGQGDQAALHAEHHKPRGKQSEGVLNSFGVLVRAVPAVHFQGLHRVLKALA